MVLEVAVVYGVSWKEADVGGCAEDEKLEEKYDFAPGAGQLPTAATCEHVDLEVRSK